MDNKDEFNTVWNNVTQKNLSTTSKRHWRLVMKDVHLYFEVKWILFSYSSGMESLVLEKIPVVSWDDSDKTSM